MHASWPARGHTYLAVVDDGDGGPRGNVKAGVGSALEAGGSGGWDLWVGGMDGLMRCDRSVRVFVDWIRRAWESIERKEAAGAKDRAVTCVFFRRGMSAVCVCVWRVSCVVSFFVFRPLGWARNDLRFRPRSISVASINRFGALIDQSTGPWSVAWNQSKRSSA